MSREHTSFVGFSYGLPWLWAESALLVRAIWRLFSPSKWEGDAGLGAAPPHAR